eukprot:3173207-Rhodomonas_salina.1
MMMTMIMTMTMIMMVMMKKMMQVSTGTQFYSNTTRPPHRDRTRPSRHHNTLRLPRCDATFKSSVFEHRQRSRTETCSMEQLRKDIAQSLLASERRVLPPPT